MIVVLKENIFQQELVSRAFLWNTIFLESMRNGHAMAHLTKVSGRHFLGNGLSEPVTSGKTKYLLTNINFELSNEY